MEIIFWNEKIDKFINILDRITSSRVRKTITALEKFGHLLEMPDSKSLGKRLFELRTLGKLCKTNPKGSYATCLICHICYINNYENI